MPIQADEQTATLKSTTNDSLTSAFDDWHPFADEELFLRDRIADSQHIVDPQQLTESVFADDLWSHVLPPALPTAKKGKGRAFVV